MNRTPAALWVVLRGVVCGCLAFLGGILATIAVTGLSTPFASHRHIESGLFNDYALRLFMGHGVDMVAIPDGGRDGINTDWWAFEYVGWYRPEPLQGGGLPTVSLDWYLSIDTYRLSMRTILYWEQFGLAPTFGFDRILFLVPPVLLFVFGGIAALWAGRPELRFAAVAGASVVLGYGLVTIALIHVVGLTVPVRGAATTFLLFPDPVVAIVRMGLGYPLVFGTLGGIYAVWMVRGMDDGPLEWPPDEAG